MNTIIEPFKIKSVESIKMNTVEDRIKILNDAHFNLFKINSSDVIIDLLTDSGTGAMSDNQWASIMTGDESYANSKSFLNLTEVVNKIFGYKYIANQW